MVVSVTIWHNPRCSKSRETLALLHARGVTPEIRLYLQDPPDLAELKAVLAMLAAPAATLARSKDAGFIALGLSADMPDSTLLAALAAHPALIERPLVIAGNKAILGRPPEAVLSILP
jgi:arsenate reductase